MRKFHLNLIEGVIKSGENKYGRYMPSRRFNLDQVPLPFAVDQKTAYERNDIGRYDKVWFCQPGSGLDKRQCTLQICFSPEDNHVKVEIIFRGKGKRIKPQERAAYHKDVDIYWQDNAWADTRVSCE